MTRMIWGAAGERFYEAGVDRGVFYPSFGDGVAWNGLISVKEAPTGGTAKPYYHDGIKYLNIAQAEEFEATIDAYSAPDAFAECEGQFNVGNGLIITQQARTSFGFSYRSRLGNDLFGLDRGYKIHIVYNALAAPPSKDNSTIDNSPSAQVLSWKVTTLPVNIPGAFPAAHFIVDSKRASPTGLAALESALYGSLSTAPYLPPNGEIYNLLNTL